MRGLVRAVMALAIMAAALPATTRAQAAQAKPVIAVMYFDNTSFGPNRAEYDGLGKGIAELLITDMAANPNVRIVERERIQALITEQNLVKAQTIDPQTAIRLGKIVGAQYMVTGTFMSDGKGRLILTARAVNVETSAITNPTRIDARSDDVLGVIAQLSTRINTDMKLPALRVGEAGSGPAAMPAGQPAATPAPAAQAHHPAEHAAAPAQAAAAQPAPRPAAQVARAARPTRKMDIKTAMLYSRALEAEDAGNRMQAVELYRQVQAQFPNYDPVDRKIARLSRG